MTTTRATGDAEKRVILPARRGKAFALRSGDRVQIVNLHGTQVVDTWAFAAGDAAEFLSLEHCREVVQKLFFEVGDSLVTNRYRPIITLVGDSSPGIHDALIAACSARMFERAGRGSGHDNCVDNLRGALAAFDLRPSQTPCPWNLFMNAPLQDGRRIAFERPVSRPGDSVELRAEMDCLMAFSACPDDVYPTNGGDGTPRDVEIVIFGPDAKAPS